MLRSVFWGEVLWKNPIELDWRWSPLSRAALCKSLARGTSFTQKQRTFNFYCQVWQVFIDKWHQTYCLSKHHYHWTWYLPNICITKYHLISTFHPLTITINIERKHLFIRPENFCLGFVFLTISQASIWIHTVFLDLTIPQFPVLFTPGQ